ncbi:MAG: FAD-binding protein [Gammaproteobacteria bacterium]
MADPHTNSESLADPRVLDLLRSHIAGEVLTDTDARSPYARDASPYRQMPMAVVRPRNRDDVVALVTIAGEHRLPLIARAAGTSLAGQCVGNGIVVDMGAHHQRIVEFDPGPGGSVEPISDVLKSPAGGPSTVVRARPVDDGSLPGGRHDRQITPGPACGELRPRANTCRRQELVQPRHCCPYGPAGSHDQHRLTAFRSHADDVRQVTAVTAMAATRPHDAIIGLQRCASKPPVGRKVAALIPSRVMP